MAGAFPGPDIQRDTPRGVPYHWLHAVSTDLVHWKELGDAIVPGELFHIESEIDPGSARQLRWTIAEHELRCDVTTSTLTAFDRSARVAMEAGVLQLELELLVDRTSVEIFSTASCLSMSFCFLPNPDTSRLALRAIGGHGRIVAMRVHELCSASGGHGPPLSCKFEQQYRLGSPDFSLAQPAPGRLG